MSFESGSIGCRVFYVPQGLPEDCVESFTERAAPPINTLGEGELSGWVTGRHLLDRVITTDSANYAGYLRLTLMKAERKIPTALLRAECKMEELAVMQAEGLQYVNRARRSEIREGIIARLLPQMPPALTGIPMVYDYAENTIYAGAMSVKQMDALAINFESTTGRVLVPMTAASAAMDIRRYDAAMMEPTSFSPELEDPLAGRAIGQDFLTWLWFYSEARGGIMAVDGVNYGIMLEGPLMFYLQGDGAHVIVLRNGVPEVSAEAKTSLLSGKKLSRAKITIGGEHESWSTTLDADDFVFRGLKLPKGEDVDAIAKFQQRMLSLNRFRVVFLAFYERFLSERADPVAWGPIQKDIHQWVASRQTKK